MPACPDTAASAKPRAEVRPINWPVTVVVFFAGSVLLWADRSNFSVAAAAWAKDLDWTPSTIGLMLSAFSLGYLIVQPIGGWIADQVGPRRTLAGSMAGWSIWVLLTPLAPMVLWLTAAFRVLLGAFEAPYIPASVAAVGRATRTGGRRILRRIDPAGDRVADLHLRGVRHCGPGRRGGVVALCEKFC